MKMRFIKKVIVCTLITLVVMTGAASYKTYAYFNRGTVGISAGRSEVTINVGESVNVSVNLSPASQDQLPGCGMAECPQMCGEKECLNENGECTCGGTVPNTYRTSVSCASGNSAVATASYNSGSVTISGNSEGTTNITLTASLRQYTDGETTITVTVNPKSTEAPVETGGNNSGSTGSGSSGNNSGSTGSGSSGNNSGSTGSSSSGNNAGNTGSSSSNAGANTNSGASGTSQSVNNANTNNNNGSVVVPNTTTGTEATTQVNKENETKKDEETKNDNSSMSVLKPGNTVETDETGYTLVETKMEGTIMFVDIDKSQNDIGKMLKIAADNKYSVVFNKNYRENVLYSWKFHGEELSNTDQLDLSIYMNEQASGEADSKLKGADNIFLTFGTEGALPSAAEISIRVSDRFSDNMALKLYSVDAQTGKMDLISDDITVTNGYAAFTISDCSMCVLTNGTAAEDTAVKVLPIVLICAAAAAAIAAIVIVVCIRKKRKEGNL